MRATRSGRLAGGAVAVCGALAVLVVLTASCGGGGSSTPAELQCASSAPAANEIALTCGGNLDSSTESIEVVLGGPTSVSTIEGFNFDVVFDAAKVRFVDGSATLGTFLSQGSVTPLLAAQVASQDPNRLVVGIHRGAAQGGVGATAAESLVLRFSFRTVGTQKLDPVALRFENAEAVDASGTPIAAITFEDGLSLSRP